MTPNPCPFCAETIAQGEDSWYYRGFGPPPSYAVRCDSCGAQGPYGNGKFRGDHSGAQAAAVELWNAAHRPATETAAEQRLQPRPSDQRSEPDNHVRCAFCDSGFLPGEVFEKPRECCVEGNRADSVALNRSPEHG